MSHTRPLSLNALVRRSKDLLAQASTTPAVHVKIDYFPIPAPPTKYILAALLLSGYQQAEDGSLVRGYFTDLRRFNARIDVLAVGGERE